MIRKMQFALLFVAVILVPALAHGGVLKTDSVCVPHSRTVVKGDTLLKIAHSEYGSYSSYAMIVKANNIADPNVIYAGSTLVISCPKQPEADSSKLSADPPAPFENIAEMPVQEAAKAIPAFDIPRMNSVEILQRDALHFYEYDMTVTPSEVPQVAEPQPKKMIYKTITVYAEERIGNLKKRNFLSRVGTALLHVAWPRIH